MSLIDKNKVFFGLIHYILSEQRNVDWLLKTSVIDFTGINIDLSDTAYKSDNLMNDVIQFAYDVKPYHTQFSKFTEKYTTDREDITINAKADFVNYLMDIRFDAITRIPDPIISDVINGKKYYCWKLKKSPFEWTSTTIYTANTLIKSNDIVYRALKRFKSSDSIEKDIENGNLVKVKHPIYTSMENPQVNSNALDYTKYDMKVLGNISAVVDEGTGGRTNITELTYNYVEYKRDAAHNLFSKSDEKELMNTHMANRICLNGAYKWNPSTGLYAPDYDEITDRMDAHFKGLSINGGTYDAERYGYDVLSYDVDKYDAPTVSTTYCMVNKTEVYEGAEYDRNFVKPGVSTFSIPLSFTGTVTAKKRLKDGTLVTLTDLNSIYMEGIYSIDIFNGMNSYESVYITIKKDATTSATFVYYAEPFIESDDDTLYKQLVQVADVVTVKTPSNGMEGSNFLVHKIDIYGTQTQLIAANGDYVISGNEVTVLGMQENEQLVITAYDYSFLYDKIYAYEDVLGLSNNIIMLDGFEYLRPWYEENRTNEMAFMVPIDGMVTKSVEPNKGMDFYRFNYKKDFYKMHSGKLEPMTITAINGETDMDNVAGITRTITLNDASMLGTKVPGRILGCKKVEKRLSYNCYISKSKEKVYLRRAISEDWKNELTDKTFVYKEYDGFLYPVNDLKRLEGLSYELVEPNHTIKSYDLEKNILTLANDIEYTIDSTLYSVITDYVGAEIIEYTSIDQATNTISGLKRAKDGTNLFLTREGSVLYKEQLGVGSIVYPSSEDIWTLIQQEEKPLDINRYKLTIRSVPSDAKVTLKADGYKQKDNTITVNEGTVVSYSVAKFGYESNIGTWTANKDTVKKVTLGTNVFTYTINPTPSDAKVELTVDGYIQQGNSIAVPSGTVVEWRVSREGYKPLTGTKTVTSTVTENKVLTNKINYSFKINPTPSDATVTLTATGYRQSGNSIIVPYNTRVSWSVSKTGYITQSGSQYVTTGTTKDITLVTS